MEGTVSPHSVIGAVGKYRHSTSRVRIECCSSCYYLPLRDVFWGSWQVCHGTQPRGRTGEQRIYGCTSSFGGSEHVDAVESGVRTAADDFEPPVDPNAFPTTARTSALVDDLYSARATALDVGGCVWATGQALPRVWAGQCKAARSKVDEIHLLTKARNASSATAAAAPPKSVTVESTCSAAGVAVGAPSTWTAVGCCTSSRRMPGMLMRVVGGGDALGGVSQ